MENVRKYSAEDNKLLLAFLKFYAVGLLLFILPFARPFFISITSLSLLLVIGIILFNHKTWNIRTVLLFLFIVLSSFFVEMEGVKSGNLFGMYQYEKALGWQINGTPVIIGLNWLFLVYASHELATRITRKPVFIIFAGAILMVIYDLLLEWVAPVMNMWSFDSFYPPMENFITWFILALFYQSCFVIFRIKTDNFPAACLFIIQWLFFL